MTNAPLPPQGEHEKIPVSERSIKHFLARQASAHADRPFATFGGKTFSFGEAKDLCHSVARGLAAQGVGEGGRVMLLLRNAPEFMLTWFGASLLGAIAVPINPELKGVLLESVIADAQPDLIVVDESLLGNLLSCESGARRAGCTFVVHPSASVPAGGNAGRLFGELVLKTGDDIALEGDPGRVQVLSYTSGTTGPSKGALLPDAQCFSTAYTFIRVMGMHSEDVLYAPLPLFHGMSSRMGLLSALVLGAHVVVDEKVSASAYWERAGRCGATLALAVRAIASQLKSQPPGPFDREHRVRAIFNTSHDNEFEMRFNIRNVSAFAMTETSFLTCSPFPDRVVGSGSVGAAHEDWELRLVDEKGEEVPVGQPGELIARPRRANIMMKGYLNKPEQTLNAWRDLWFHTSDILRKDEDGNYFFLDRKKDRIRRRGHNVSSSEVERCVELHPSVLEVAALPVSAPDGNDEIKVVIALRAGAPATASELHEWMGVNLPRFMMPRFIEIIDSLPRTAATGRIEKHKLQQQGITPSTWDSQSQPAPSALLSDPHRSSKK